MQKFLIIQTAFIGDVVLATALIEKIHLRYPESQIDFLLRKGNEGLLHGHPYLHKVLIWNKKKNKYKNLLQLIQTIRLTKYDVLINVQRFAATGLLTVLSGAKKTIGFNKNPWSRFFTLKIKHEISSDQNLIHEIDRNQKLIEHFTDNKPAKPRLYPTTADYEMVNDYINQSYICIAPASVWFTKQYPADKWVSFINKIPVHYTVYLLGAPGDIELCNSIQNNTTNTGVVNLAGKLNYLQSVALQEKAVMNYVNDSAPMHFASSVNAPVTAVYCSTVPQFGFGPLSDNSTIIETTEKLACRPCGLHGYKACPLQHFNCAYSITDSQLLNVLNQ